MRGQWYRVDQFIVVDECKNRGALRARIEHPVVVAAAPAESAAPAVNAGGGADHEIDTVEFNRRDGNSHRFGNPQLFILPIFASVDHPVEQPILARDRQQHRDAGRARPAQKRIELRFKRGRQKRCHPLCVSAGYQLLQPGGDCVAERVAFSLRTGHSTLARFDSQSAFCLHDWVISRRSVENRSGDHRVGSFGRVEAAHTSRVGVGWYRKL